MIKFEKEVCRYLNLPSIPRREWNGKDSFAKGVAIVRLAVSGQGYAVCTYDKETDEKPRVTKCFVYEPFYEIEKVFVVPNYMSTSEKDIEEMDLDEESKKRAMEIVSEANELAKKNDDEDEIDKMKKLPEWIFDEIHSIEEAQAWLRRYNTTNKIKGRIPDNEETIKMRLLNIYSQMKNKK